MLGFYHHMHRDNDKKENCFRFCSIRAEVLFDWVSSLLACIIGLVSSPNNKQRNNNNHHPLLVSIWQPLYTMTLHQFWLSYAGVSMAGKEKKLTNKKVTMCSTVWKVCQQFHLLTNFSNCGNNIDQQSTTMHLSSALQLLLWQEEKNKQFDILATVMKLMENQVTCPTRQTRPSFIWLWITTLYMNLLTFERSRSCLPLCFHWFFFFWVGVYASRSAAR